MVSTMFKAHLISYLDISKVPHLLPLLVRHHLWIETCKMRWSVVVSDTMISYLNNSKIP